MTGPAVRTVPHDLIVEEFSPPFGFGLTPWFTSKPVISIVQWFYFDEWQRRYGLPFERIMRRFSRRAGYRNFIVQTGKMESYFRDLMPEAQIWRLPCGVDQSLFEVERTEGHYALFLGRLDVEHKGLDLLIDVWASLAASGERIPLRIAGEGPGRSFLERHIRERNLHDLITLIGRVEGPAKIEALQNCAFMVMPSRQETFGITALEGMASSKPVVAFDIDNLNEVLSPKGSFLVPKFDLGCFSRSVSTLWQDKDLRKQLGEFSQHIAKSFSWDEIAARQICIYKTVINGTAKVFS